MSGNMVGKCVQSNFLLNSINRKDLKVEPAPGSQRSQEPKAPVPFRPCVGVRRAVRRGDWGDRLYRWGQKNTGDHGVMDESSFACWNVEVFKC